MMFFAAAADLGRMFYSYVAIQNAVKEGAVYGAHYPLCDATSSQCPDPGNVTWRVQREAPTVRNPDGTELSPDVECKSPSGVVRTDLRQCVAGDTYVVGVAYRFQLITPILSSLVGSELTLHSEATAVVLNQAFDPTPGASVTKLVNVTNATNAAAVTSSCFEPDPSGSPGFYRAPCKDAAENDVEIRFDAGDTITYKVIVRNQGGTTLTSLSMVDSLGWPTGCPAEPTTLAVGSANYTCTYTGTAPAPGGTEMPYENIITVDAAEIDPVQDEAIVTIEQSPANLVVAKDVSPYKNGNDGDGVPSFGNSSTVTWYRSTQISTLYAWFRVRVINNGGQAVSNLTIADSRLTLPYGQNTTTAQCDAKPTTLAAGAAFQCRYRVTLSSAGTYANTVTATGTGAASTSATATVQVVACSGSNRVIPSVVGLSKTTATSRWTSAGFASNKLTSWSGSNSTLVVTQNQMAYSCVPTSTAMTITKAVTP
jgi:uncharacterized repeat protein (TIGR01451 family)